MTTLSVIRLMPSKASEIEDFVNKTLALVDAGEVNPLELKINLKAIEKTVAEIDSKTKELQLREAGKYTAKSFEAHGAKIEIAELGTKYDYSKCNDVVYDRLQEQLNKLKEQIKKREELLKAIGISGIHITDEETGEIYTAHAPVKSSTTGLKISIL